MKNRIAKTLLAGTASLALLASPALAVDALAPAGKVLAQTGVGVDGDIGIESATGAAGKVGTGGAGVGGAGAAGAGGSAGTSVGTGAGSVGVGAEAGASGSAGTSGVTTDGAMDATGSGETTGSLGTPSADLATLLEQRGYTDIAPLDDDASAAANMSGHSAFKARNSTGDQVELVVDNTTGAVVRETTEGAKNQ